MKIRIPVAVTKEGKWFAYGANIGHLLHSAEDLIGHDHLPMTVYVEADVPLPVDVVVQGTVKESPRE